MSQQINDLISRIDAMQAELEAEFAKQSAELRYGFEHGRAVFEEEVLRRHREMQTRLWAYIRKARPMVVLTAPFIYSLIIPLVLLDLFVSLYQAVCFPAYGLEKVKRSDYLIFDRGHLAYLNALEKLNCAYCSYANGLIAYVREIAGRTEAYWCPVKHARKAISAHEKYRDFVAFGDAEAYRKRVEDLSSS
ncbi:MAG: hypothetical protein WBN97_04890 [Parvibaculum sp.]